MIRRPPRSTRTDTLFPYTTLFRSGRRAGTVQVQAVRNRRQGGLGRQHHHHACALSDFTPGWPGRRQQRLRLLWRSEEHTSELQSLMRISYAVFCLKKKKQHIKTHINYTTIKLYTI